MGSHDNEARAAGAAQASGHARATTVLVDAPEWATPEDVAVAFPALSDEQIGAFRRFGVERAVGGGEVLYRRQDPHFAMYVVLEGRVAIIDDYGGAQERVLLEYGPGGFVGEYNLLTGQASYMSAVAAEPTRLVEIQRGPLRELMAQEETLGELVLRALTAQIEELTIRIEAAIAPFARQVAQLDEIPGVGATGAQEIIAEIGVDVARFPTPGHLVSWAKFAPTPRQSAARADPVPPARATPGSAALSAKRSSGPPGPRPSSAPATTGSPGAAGSGEPWSRWATPS